MITANPDTLAYDTRLEELDALFWAKTRADVIGLEEVRRYFDNRFGTTCGGGKYTLFHTACDVLSSGAPNLGVGIMVRTQLAVSYTHLTLPTLLLV